MKEERDREDECERDRDDGGDDKIHGNKSGEKK